MEQLGTVQHRVAAHHRHRLGPSARDESAVREHDGTRRLQSDAELDAINGGAWIRWPVDRDRQGQTVSGCVTTKSRRWHKFDSHPVP